MFENYDWGSLESYLLVPAAVVVWYVALSVYRIAKLKSLDPDAQALYRDETRRRRDAWLRRLHLR